MARKNFTPTSEELKAMRLEKTKNYLESIGVMMPILKDARAVGTTDIIRNKDFIRVIDVFLIDHIVELMDDIKFAKLMGKKNRRKAVLTDFIKQRLEPTIKNLPDLVWDILVSTVMVDNIDNVEGEWLDFEYPVAQVCINNYGEQTSWLGQELSNTGMFNLYDDIADYIDYVSMIISINLFRFSRKVDEQSRYQLMGNIGSLEDIRNAVELTFIGEVFGDNKNKEWATNILEELKNS